MKASVFRLEEAGLIPLVPVKISFARYLRMVEQEAAKAEGISRRMLEYIVKTFERHPVYAQPFDHAEDLLKHPELLQLVQSTVYPLIGGSGKAYFALCTPFTAELFYMSDPLHRLFATQQVGTTKFLLSDLYTNANKITQEKQFYQLVLERYYHIPATGGSDIVFSMKNAITALPRYIRQETDLRFT
jgi:hypothetical protein